MKILHEKTHICQDNSWAYGQRRRRCFVCGKTWTVWKRKLGRKRSRPDKNLLQKIFVERERLSRLLPVRKKRISVSGASRRLNKAMLAVADEKNQVHFTGGQYILIIDALWYRFQRQRWTLYLAAARTVKGKRARFLSPVLLPGKENLFDWQAVISQLPLGLKKRVVAVVSDGWRGVERVAKENGWILQRCHFHFISQLQVNRGRWKQLPDQRYREQIYQTARKLLTAKTRINFYKEQLIEFTNHPQCPRRLRIIIHDYLRRLRYFRSYLKHSELNLPTTTNCVESMNKLIRERCRYLNNPQALKRWSKTFLKFHSTILCNGANHTQN
mgnify:CR=1 FL=1